MKRRLSLLTAFLTASFLVLLTAAPAQALWSPTLQRGQVVFSACSWHWKAGSNGDDPNPVNVRVGGKPWAANSRSSDNGALQSFQALAQSGVANWNNVTLNANYRVGMRYQESTTDADIRFYNSMPSGSSSATLGITYMQIARTDGQQSSGVTCPPVDPNQSWAYREIIKVNIYNKVSDVWFTQTGNDQWGRDVRKEWEKCFPDPDTGAPPTNDPRLTNYTCQKKADFGSVITHELGHAIGLPHADIFGLNSPQGLAAQCGPTKVKLQSTMCRVVPEGRTAQRTLEASDVDAYSYRATY